MPKPQAVPHLTEIPCVVDMDPKSPQFGWLSIPHVDGNWVTAAELPAFSMETLRFWLADNPGTEVVDPDVLHAVVHALRMADAVCDGGPLPSDLKTVEVDRDRLAALRGAMHRLTKLPHAPVHGGATLTPSGHAKYALMEMLGIQRLGRHEAVVDRSQQARVVAGLRPVPEGSTLRFWWSLVEASATLNGSPLSDNDIALSWTGNGASARVTAGELRALMALPQHDSDCALHGTDGEALAHQCNCTTGHRLQGYAWCKTCNAKARLAPRKNDDTSWDMCCARCHSILMTTFAEPDA